jgi:hypothetical protein
MKPLVQTWPTEEVTTGCHHRLFSWIKADVALKAGVASTATILVNGTLSTHFIITIQFLPPCLF